MKSSRVQEERSLGEIAFVNLGGIPPSDFSGRAQSCSSSTPLDATGGDEVKTGPTSAVLDGIRDQEHRVNYEPKDTYEEAALSP